MILKKYKYLFYLLFISMVAYGQTDKERARNLAYNAIETMDAGNLDESIFLLDTAIELDPNNIDYRYEKALAYYRKQDYDVAIDILESLKGHKDETESIYQLLGNAYDLNGTPEKALATYHEGLEIFPESGYLFMESGIVEYKQGSYENAINSWEKGIKVAPHYPSNYYHLAQLFCHSEEKIWGLLYAEMLVLLEPASARGREVSQLLYDTYDKVYVAEDKDAGSYNLTKNNKVKAIDDQSFKIPFEMNFAIIFMLSSTNFIDKIDIESIFETRVKFLQNWFSDKKLSNSYPNKLLSYQKQLLDAGHFEAYTYILLADGNIDEYLAYYKDNQEKVEAAAEYISNHPIAFEEGDLFTRPDYE